MGLFRQLPDGLLAVLVGIPHFRCRQWDTTPKLMSADEAFVRLHAFACTILLGFDHPAQRALFLVHLRHFRDFECRKYTIYQQNTKKSACKMTYRPDKRGCPDVRAASLEFRTKPIRLAVLL